MKLVVNSNMRYLVPLSSLIESLIAAGWKTMDDVVIVRGGASQDCVGKRLIRDVTTLKSNQPVLVVDLQIENFDYHGFVALQRYASHPEISDDWYMYVLDTVTFTNGFPETFHSFILNRKHLLKYKDGVELSTMFTCALPNSNICVFNKAFIHRYGTIFESKVMSKKEAMELECGHRIDNIKPVPAYAENKQPLARRECKGQVDCYNTGFQRDIWFYPDLRLNKYILWGMAGDLVESEAFSY